MRAIMALVFGVVPMLAATVGFAQTQPPQINDTMQLQVLPEQVTPKTGQMPPAIGMIAGVPVRVWAPVEEPYDQQANRNGAANPILPDTPPWWGLGPTHL